MSTLTIGEDTHDGLMGGWRIWAQPPGGERRDITVVRGDVTVIGELSDESPFAWVDTTLTFPAISYLDPIGSEDLDWISDSTEVDVEWVGALPSNYPYSDFVYEGLMEDFELEGDGLVVSVKGAMRQLDNYQAKPEHLAQPMTYEYAIRRQFEAKPDLRVTPPPFDWPDWWTQTYTPEPNRNAAYIPTGVKPGDKWTAMLTRSTGNWEQSLSSYVQTLLSSMWTSRGRWDLDLLPGRHAVLRHLDFKNEDSAGGDVIELDAVYPGVEPHLRILNSQSANVWYGQGKSLQGVGYTGMEVSQDGRRVRYKPLAADRRVEPVTDRNGWLRTEKVRREALLQHLDGLDQAQAEQVAAFQYAHFSEPGLVGTIDLSTDVCLAGGDLMSRFVIRAGMTLRLAGLMRSRTGILLHIVKVDRDLAGGTVTLTVDSKYRDALTVRQIQAKGRDALNIPRLLIGGQFTPQLPDQLVPWSYADGSGYIPSAPGYNSLRLFDGMPDDIAFPWQDWTVTRPPGDRSWRSCYIGIGPTKPKADDNWAYLAARGGTKLGFPIRMAQAGRISMIQVAAYDLDGNVLEVPFHVSLYTSNGVNVAAMPQIPAGSVDGYAAGQRYPFFQGAWERYSAAGVEVSNEITLPVSSAGFVKGWGSGRVKAGYWPGSHGTHDPTGLLVDTEPFDISVPVGDGSGDWGVNPYSARQSATYAGYMYLMVYCDAQATSPVFFAGRMFLEPPGQGD